MIHVNLGTDKLEIFHNCTTSIVIKILMLFYYQNISNYGNFLFIYHSDEGNNDFWNPDLIPFSIKISF